MNSGDMESVPDWSELPTDVLCPIARFLPTMEDVMAFRGVCTEWRSAVPTDKFLTVSKLPLLMLPEKPTSAEREFYSLSKRKICTRKHLPEARNNRSIDVGFGWVLTLSTEGEGSVFLSKPFSSAATRIDLPSFKKYPGYYNLDLCYYEEEAWNIFFIRKGMLTANPSETLNFKLWVSVNYGMGIWKNGDEDWTYVFAQQPEDMVLRRDGKMYKLVCSALDDGPRFDEMQIWDPQATDFSKAQATVPIRNGPKYSQTCVHYLVDSTDGELLLITRNNAGHFHAYFEGGADHFGVMKLDPVKGEFKDVDGLGKDAVFVGDNVSVAVDATEFPGVIKPNCIYFTDDRFEAYMQRDLCPSGGGKDMGIYNVEDGSIERFGIESPFSRVCPPQWIFPSF